MLAVFKVSVVFTVVVFSVLKTYSQDFVEKEIEVQIELREAESTDEARRLLQQRANEQVLIDMLKSWYGKAKVEQQMSLIRQRVFTEQSVVILSSQPGRFTARADSFTQKFNFRIRESKLRDLSRGLFTSSARSRAKVLLDLKINDRIEGILGQAGRELPVALNASLKQLSDRIQSGIKSDRWSWVPVQEGQAQGHPYEREGSYSFVLSLSFERHERQQVLLLVTFGQPNASLPQFSMQRVFSASRHHDFLQWLTQWQQSDFTAFIDDLKLMMVDSTGELLPTRDKFIIELKPVPLLSDREAIRVEIERLFPELLALTESRLSQDSFALQAISQINSTDLARLFQTRPLRNFTVQQISVTPDRLILTGQSRGGG
jgi:hypothetical protein